MTPWVEPVPDSPLALLVADRAAIIGSIDKVTNCDVLIVGGGIHGAAFARLAAVNGLSTVLLERADYASATSSRSSKMAHGGLRYLEMLDFTQVFEGIRAREELFHTASHLVKPQEFLLPLYEGSGARRFAMTCGLTLYDLMARVPGRRQSWIPAAQMQQNPFAQETKKLAGAFRYFDGLMRDTRLVLENILSARREGALCLNYAAVNSISPLTGGRVFVGWTDVLTGRKHEINAGVVINCAGPWVASMGRLKPSELAARIRFSQGAHLLFSKTWEGPALFLPMEGKGRYYWVWPHFAGTLVGTTEREISDVPDDPQPTNDEIQEILKRLERDLPGSGLDRSTLHYAFAGIRTLPLRKAGGSVSQLSRKHIWSLSGGVLSLIGGKFTTASWTAYEGLKLVYKMSGLRGKPVSLGRRLFPGAINIEENSSIFRAEASKHGVSAEVQDRVLARMGSLVRYFHSFPDWYEPLGDLGMRGEVEFALRVEQAETFEDLMRRRLELEYLAGHGAAVEGAVCSMLRAARPQADVDRQVAQYHERLAKLETCLRA